jgi:arsenate reductase-like glutaredoxin family protein
MTEREEKLVLAFAYCRGFTADRIVRIMWDLPINTRPFMKKRGEVTRLLDKTEQKMNFKELRLIELLEQGDKILKDWTLEKGVLSLTDMV